MVQERISVQREETPLQITSGVKTQFQGIAKWAIILSFIGFTIISMVLMAAVLSTINMGILRNGQAASPIFIGVGYLIVCLLLLIPMVALFQFGSQLKKALTAGDQGGMDNAFGKLKSGLRYSGLALAGAMVFGLLGAFL